MHPYLLCFSSEKIISCKKAYVPPVMQYSTVRMYMYVVGAHSSSSRVPGCTRCKCFTRSSCSKKICRLPFKQFCLLRHYLYSDDQWIITNDSLIIWLLSRRCCLHHSPHNSVDPNSAEVPLLGSSNQDSPKKCSPVLLYVVLLTFIATMEKI